MSQPSRASRRERRVVAGLVMPVAEEQPLAGTRDAELYMRRHGAGRRERPIARIGVGAIRPGHGGKRGPGVIDREREHRHAVERAAGGHDAKGRDQAKARLQSDDIIEARRNAAGAGRVGAERERHQPGRDSDGRPELDPPGIKSGLNVFRGTP